MRSAVVSCDFVYATDLCSLPLPFVGLLPSCWRPTVLARVHIKLHLCSSIGCASSPQEPIMQSGPSWGLSSGPLPLIETWGSCVQLCTSSPNCFFTAVHSFFQVHLSILLLYFPLSPGYKDCQGRFFPVFCTLLGPLYLEPGLIWVGTKYLPIVFYMFSLIPCVWGQVHAIEYRYMSWESLLELDFSFY